MPDLPTIVVHPTSGGTRTLVVDNIGCVQQLQGGKTQVFLGSGETIFIDDLYSEFWSAVVAKS